MSKYMLLLWTDRNNGVREEGPIAVVDSRSEYIVVVDCAREEVSACCRGLLSA